MYVVPFVFASRRPLSSFFTITKKMCVYGNVVVASGFESALSPANGMCRFARAHYRMSALPSRATTCSSSTS